MEKETVCKENTRLRGDILDMEISLDPETVQQMQLSNDRLQAQVEKLSKALDKWAPGEIACPKCKHRQRWADVAELELAKCVCNMRAERCTKCKDIENPHGVAMGCL